MSDRFRGKDVLAWMNLKPKVLSDKLVTYLFTSYDVLFKDPKRPCLFDTLPHHMT
jgi:hypothetical protein